MNVLALDIGEKRIGIAASDALGLTAQPLETYSRIGRKRDIEYIDSLARTRASEALVVGLPRNMDGSLGKQAKYTCTFMQGLLERGWRILWIDERFTTAVAQRALIESGVERKRRKRLVDRIAAMQILSTYLASPARAKEWNEV